MIDTYKIGTITKTHGISGELSMNFTDDVWDRADADYVFLEADGRLQSMGSQRVGHD